MMWLVKLLFSSLGGFLARLFSQDKRDALVRKAHKADEHEQELDASQTARKDRTDVEDNIRRTDGDTNRDRLRKWTGKHN